MSKKIVLMILISFMACLTFSSFEAKADDVKYVSFGVNIFGNKQDSGEKVTYSVTAGTDGRLDIVHSGACTITVTNREGAAVKMTENGDTLRAYVKGDVYHITITEAAGEWKIKPLFTKYTITCTLAQNKKLAKKTSVKITTKEKVTMYLVPDYVAPDECEDYINNPGHDLKRLSDKPVKHKKTTVKENGIYTVIAVDEWNHTFSQTFTVSNLDSKKPLVTGVANKGIYDRPVTIEVFDDNTVTLTLNGKRIKNGKTVSKNGKYVLVAEDKAGNKTTVNFEIRG